MSTISTKERLEVTRRLRELGNLVYSADNTYELMADALGVDDFEGTDVLFDRLADLIDRPTCTIVCECDAYSSWGERIDGMRLYELSCGHHAVGFEKPRYCPKCGSVIIDVKR